jgi:hypothetical protein
MLSWQGRLTMAGCCRAFIACLLDNYCVTRKDLPESIILEYPIEVHQRLQRYLRLSQLHCGTGRAVEHPPLHDRRHSGFVLNNDDCRSAALLAVVKPDMPTVKCMPAVMNLDFFPDMGRMFGRWPLEGRAGYFATQSAGPRQAPSFTALC